jgi:pimeloyl-ACP methyl ester carboxylesterase
VTTPFDRAGTARVAIEREGRRVVIEHAWVGADEPDAPLLVFLHEGLGSVSLWKGFPQRLCEAIGARGLVYSRPGYGRSSPRPEGERTGPDFMHIEAIEVLPAVLAALAVDTRAAPPWLFGHSDGGSIALIHAARFPDRVAGLVVAAPHILVEPVTLASIRRAHEAWQRGDLRAGLARHHDDPASAFGTWSDAWLDPAFEAWSIEAELAGIRCPVLAVQGLDDEYGTLEQVRGIARRVPGTVLLELPACGHSPQRDQPDVLIAATRRIVDTHARAAHRNPLA